MARRDKPVSFRDVSVRKLWYVSFYDTTRNVFKYRQPNNNDNLSWYVNMYVLSFITIIVNST